MSRPGRTPGSVEVAGPGGAPAHAEGAVCLDCGTPLAGPYCHRCGQRAQSRLVPLRRLIGSALDEVIGFDTRFARTLRLLFTRPGLLTLEFWAGRRTRHTPPVRLYLLASLVYFVTLELTGSGRFFFFTVTGGDLELRQFVERLPRLMFLLLPAFAALLGLLARRAGRLYAEHFVFALHYHTAAFLLLTCEAAVWPLIRDGVQSGATTALPFVAGATVAGAAQLGTLAYLYLALRRVYDGGRTITVARTVVLFVGYMAVLMVVGTLSIPELRAVAWETLFG